MINKLEKMLAIFMLPKTGIKVTIVVIFQFLMTNDQVFDSNQSFFPDWKTEEGEGALK